MFRLQSVRHLVPRSSDAVQIEGGERRGGWARRVGAALACAASGAMVMGLRCAPWPEAIPNPLNQGRELRLCAQLQLKALPPAGSGGAVSPTAHPPCLTELLLQISASCLALAPR